MRCKATKENAAMAQLVEHILGKDEVPGPNPGSSSRHPRCSFEHRGFGFVSAFSTLLWGVGSCYSL